MNVFCIKAPYLLTVSILHPILAPRIIPGYRLVDADNLTGAALKATCILYYYLAGLLAYRVEMGRTGRDAEMLRALLAHRLFQFDMALSVVLNGVQRYLLFYSHTGDSMKFAAGCAAQNLQLFYNFHFNY